MVQLQVRGTAEHKSIPIEETLRLLGTNSGGLTEAEARQRLEQFGYNEVAQKKKNLVLEFLSRFWGPMPWLLEVAIILSYFLGHYLEAAIIGALIIINAIIGYWHSRSARTALDLLKQKLAVKARVLRDGVWTSKQAREVVPGDVAAVGLGEIVPADARVIDGSVSADQSALTGESLPVEAGLSDTIYSGSVVKRGQARCVIINTGRNTYFGKTVELVRIAQPRSHQEEIMATVVKYMMYLGIAALVMVAVDAFVMGTDPLVVATFAVVFLMGAVPVALPAVMTIVQAVGAMELAHKGVLVTRLSSIQDAASIDTLCLDKTGTVTMNQLAVKALVPLRGHTEQDIITVAALTVKPESEDAIDRAIMAYGETHGMNLSAFNQISFTPFDPATKRAEATVELGGRRFRAVKGAPQIVMGLCPGAEEATRETARLAVEALSEKGYRTMMVAQSEDNDLEDLWPVGLLALADPPRPDAASMLAAVRELGIKCIMLTGDNVAIARETVRDLGMRGSVIRMADLKGLSEAEQARIVDESAGLAEIYPEDKYQIVKLLQSHGHMVGMTGDGVNDAPALKQAEIGIAVSGATDVAKASASAVLTEPGIRVIVDALKTSRQIHQRMLTWVINKVTKTVQFVGLLTLGFFWLHDFVISLLGMALLVFANDFVTMSLSTDHVKYTSNPNKWNVKNITGASFVIGIFFVIEGWLAIIIGRDYFGLSGDALLSFILLMLIFSSQFRVYIVRERRHFWSSRPGRELLIATLAAVAVFALFGAFGVVIARLTPNQVLAVLAFSAIFTFAIDLPKYYVFRKFGL